MAKEATKKSTETPETNDWPKTAKELLQTRYKAFETGEVEYIANSHHPDTRDQVQESAIRNWSKNSKWLGLEIGEVQEKGDKTFIDFTVIYERDFERHRHTEHAEFRKHEGRWYYYDSEFPAPETIRREGEKLGRNDPCHCGSGKKFKKCHGKAA